MIPSYITDHIYNYYLQQNDHLALQQLASNGAAERALMTEPLFECSYSRSAVDEHDRSLKFFQTRKGLLACFYFKGGMDDGIHLSSLAQKDIFIEIAPEGMLRALDSFTDAEKGSLVKNLGRSQFLVQHDHSHMNEKISSLIIRPASL